jgi:hypothetical protein
MLRPGIEARWKRTNLPEIRSFDSKFDAMGAPSGERGRSAQARRTSAEFVPENVETSAQERAVEPPQEAPTLSPQRAHGQRSNRSSAFWGIHVEAMNFSGMGHAEYAAALGLSAHSLRIWRDRLEQSGLAIAASSECPGSTK